MPIIHVHLIVGRSESQKSDMIRAVTAAVAETLAAPPESIRIIINEVPATDYGMGGETAKARGR